MIEMECDNQPSKSSSIPCTYCDKVSANSAEYVKHLLHHDVENLKDEPSEIDMLESSDEDALVIDESDFPVKNDTHKTDGTSYLKIDSPADSLDATNKTNKIKEDGEKDSKINKNNKDSKANNYKEESLEILRNDSGISVSATNSAGDAPDIIKTSPTKLSSPINCRLPKKKSFHCDICFKVFKDASNFRVHMRIHTNEKPFKCNVCDKAFTAPATLKQHAWTHKSKKPFVCEICSRGFCQISNYRLHLKSHNDKKMTMEKVDSSSDEDSVNDRQSSQRLSDKTPNACSVCDAKFRTRSSLAAHVNNHHVDIKPYKCKLCPKAYSSSGSLFLHLQTHNNAKKYKCDICDKAFHQKGNMETHKKVHARHSHPCNYCSLSFINTNQLSNHIVAVHSKKTCNECQINFSSESELNLHLKLHEFQKSSELYRSADIKVFLPKVEIQKLKTRNVSLFYICEPCFSCYPSLKAYKKHKRRKHGEKYLVSQNDFEMCFHCCKYCKKSFAIKLEYEEHMKIHSSISANKAVNSKILNEHSYSSKTMPENDVSDDKTFNCHHCEKRFHEQWQCDSHMITHIKHLKKPSIKSTRKPISSRKIFTRLTPFAAPALIRPPLPPAAEINNKFQTCSDSCSYEDKDNFLACFSLKRN